MECCVAGVLTNLTEHTIATLEPELAASGFKPSHAGPVLRSYLSGAAYAASNDRKLPSELRRLLRDQCEHLESTIVARQVADDGTTKLLLRLADGRTVESVLMPDHRADRAAGCLSSQVGCAMGCDFCATTKNGFDRNLTAGEIVTQFLALRQQAHSVRSPPPDRGLHGHGRADAQPRQRLRSDRADRFERDGRTRPQAGHRFPQWDWFRESTRCAPRGSTSTWRYPCMPRTTPLGSGCCPRGGDLAFGKSWRRPTATSRKPNGRSRSNIASSRT